MKYITTKIFVIIIILITALLSNKQQLIIKNVVFINFFNSLAPQGWGFFTKDPKEENFYLYKVENGKIENFNIMNFSKEYYFGLSRTPRIISIDVAFLTEKLQNKWHKNISMDSISRIKPIDIKKNDSLTALPLGVYIIEVKKIVPLEWFNDNQNDFVPNEKVIFRLNENK